MRSFALGRWSGDAQRLCKGTVRIRLPVATAGTYRLTLYATRAPDFARILPKLDGKPLGEPVELWAPVVLPTGPLALGAHTLTRGSHILEIAAAGRHPRSTDDKIGLDAIALEPIERR